MKSAGERGQISIEFILIVGAVLTMTVVAIPIVLKNAEMNRGVIAARDGATFGAGMRGLGFSSTGGNVAGVVKIEKLNYTVTDVTDAPDNVTINIYARIPSNMDSSTICSSIRTQSQRNIAYAFTGQWPSGAIVPLANRTGSYYVFKVSCTPLS